MMNTTTENCDRLIAAAAGADVQMDGAPVGYPGPVVTASSDCEQVTQGLNSKPTAPSNLKQHPLSAAFPPMTDEDKLSLTDSIINIGMQNPSCYTRA